ncbi:hypothetical protein LSAT2_000309 [Lamellibrachia satsuma]|nr:hypothetical protein LSAT2_000309 [Lamellibrachia satsuma]
MEGLRIVFVTAVVCAALLATSAEESSCDDWQWETVSDKLLAGYNDLTLLNQDNSDECKRICKEQETNFTCRSVEYSKIENSCHLSAAKRSTIEGKMHNSAGVTYYELFCADKEEEESTMNQAMQYFTDHPAYVVIFGMGSICLLLVLVAIIIILTAPARGKKRKQVDDE